MMASISSLNIFIKDMREFPCSFNVGSANHDFANNVFDTKGFHEPQLKKNNWSNIKKYLEEDVDELDPDLVDPTWKDNLRVRVYAELGDFDKALELNKDILERSPENLVALANSGFLFALKFQFDEAKNKLKELKEIQKRECFDRIKHEAICEQGYIYFKFSEYNNSYIHNAISLLEHCVKDVPNDHKQAKYTVEKEKLNLMLGCLYRRYGNTTRNDNVQEWVSRAVEMFNLIKKSTSSNSVKSICYVELARLNKNGQENGIPVSDKSVLKLCQLAVKLNPKSKRILIVAGPMLVSLKEEKDLSLAEILLQKIVENTREPLAYTYLGGVRFSQAKIARSQFPKIEPFRYRNNPRNDLMKKLLNCIQKIPVYSEKNTFFRKAVESFTFYLQSDGNDPNHYCTLAFKMFQGRLYDDVWDICEKIVGETRSKLSVYHIDAYYILSLCCAIKFVNSSDEENLEELEKKCLEMVVCCLRCAAVLLIQEKTNTVDHQLLWQGLNKKPENIPYHIMDPNLNYFDRLQKLVSFFRQALPDLERIIQKTEEDWNDVTQIEQELEQLKNTNLNLALLYLSLINLRPETRQRISWRNSHVVRAIKLEAAKDIFTQGKLGVCHDGIWQEIFHEEFLIDHKSKSFQMSLLDRFIQSTSCDVFIVENIQSTNHKRNDVTVSHVLKDVTKNMYGLTVMTSADMSDPDEIRQVISRSTVLIVIQKQKQEQGNRNETNLNPTLTRSDGNDSSVLTQSLEIFAASSKEGTTPRHAIIAVVEDENHEDELRIPKELSGHSQLTFTLEEVKVLEEMSSSREDGQVNVFMKLFKTILRQC